MLATLLGLLGNTAVINLAVQLIENYMSSSAATDAQRATLIQLVATLRTMGIANLRSGFSDEQAQKQSIDDKWKSQEAAETTQPPKA